MNPPDYAVIIATRERPDDLKLVLEGLVSQVHPPAKVVVVDASDGPETRMLCDAVSDLPMEWQAAEQRSAARQRNQGARGLSTPLLAFCDDDITFPPEHFLRLVQPFAAPPDDRPVAGTGGRIIGLSHPVPGPLLRAYYRLQAGYDDPHYGARLFGPGINTHPCYDHGPPVPLIASEWLNSTCVVFRRDLFEKEQFPAFDGYSYLEDVHLSGRMARHGSLWFVREAAYEHHERPGPAKRNATRLARMYLRNQRRVAREVMGLSTASLWWKQLLHRLFMTIAIVRQRPDRLLARLWGTWTA